MALRYSTLCNKSKSDSPRADSASLIYPDPRLSANNGEGAGLFINIGKYQPCAWSSCASIGTEKMDKNSISLHCKKHFRFLKMRYTAKAYGKYVPTFSELERAFRKLSGFRCVGCDKVMRWTKKESSLADTVTLQHDADGGIRLICFSCNDRHMHYPGDSFYTRNRNMKLCGMCKTEKPFDEFTKSRDKYSFLKLGGHCRRCRATRRQSAIK